MPLTPQQIAEMDSLTGLETPEVDSTHPNATSRISELDNLVKSPHTGDPKAPFQATGKEGVVKGGAKAIGNAPGSTFKLIKNVTEAVVHPIKTVKAIKDVVKGGGAKAAQVVIDNTDFGQMILREGKKRGGNVIELPDGRLQAGDTEDIEKFEAMTQFFKDRYGSMDKFKETAIEDPVGVLADVASVFSGAGSGLKLAGLPGVAEKVSTVSKVVDPLNAIPATIKKTKQVAADSTPGKIVAEISPTSYKLQQGQVAKALELTPGDLSTIKSKTGNDVTDFIVKNDLIRQTPEEIATALHDTRKTRMDEVRGEISRVPSIYSPDQVPNVKKGLEVILQGVDEVPGLETVADEIRALYAKEKYTLEDVQLAKELIDENSNIYSKVGDVKNASQARGLDNIRKDLRKFIEDEVSLHTDGQTNIRQLNNDVQTTFAIEEAILNRATRGQSRQYITVFDAMLGTGAYATMGPYAAVGLVVAKKVAESPAFRLWTAKLLAKQPVQFVKKAAQEFAAKNLSPETKATLQSILDEAAANSQYIESGSNALPAVEEE